MNIILYLLQLCHQLYQQNCWLSNFICRYIPLKQWAFDDSHSPKYQKFKIDQLPKIIYHHQDWDWQDLNIREYMTLKEKEGWEKSTLNMIRSSVTRFCSFLVTAGLSDFSQLSAEVLKEFNLWDRHLTAEGKNAYNVRIRQFIRFLERKEVVPYGIHQALCCSAASKEKIIVTLTREEKGAIKEKHTNCHSPMELRDRAMMLLGRRWV